VGLRAVEESGSGVPHRVVYDQCNPPKPLVFLFQL